jgi:5,10-methylenetetrahydromethanopterin reductase
LNRLAPGRIDFGVGTGFTGRRTMGLGAMKLADMEEYIRVVMGLLDGETAEFSVEGKRQKIAFLNPELALINLTDPVRLHISAYGPRARALTARLGAGWINFVGDVPGGVAAMQGMHRAADVALSGLPNSSPVPASLAEPVARYVELAREFEPADARYLMNHRGHLMAVKDIERPFVTAEMIQRTTFAGQEADLIGRVRALRDAGYTQFTIQLVPGQESAIEDWARIKNSV